MKTKQNMRRLVALTLATAVTLPQGSPALAASLEFTKASVIRLSEQRLTTALTQSQGESAEKQFPLLTMATKTNGASTKLAKATWRTETISDLEGGFGPKLTLPVDKTELEEDGSDHTSSSDPSENVSDPKLAGASQEEMGKGGPDVSTLSAEEENAPSKTKGKVDQPPTDGSPESVGGEGTISVDDTCSQDGSAPDSNEDGVGSPAQGGEEGDGTGENAEGEDPGEGNPDSGTPGEENPETTGGEGSGGEDEDPESEDEDPEDEDEDLEGEDPAGEDESSEGEDPEDEDVEGEELVDGDEESLEDQEAVEGDAQDKDGVATFSGGDVPVVAAEEASSPKIYNYLIGYGVGVGITSDTKRYLTEYESRFQVELSDAAETAYKTNGSRFGTAAFGSYGVRYYDVTSTKGMLQDEYTGQTYAVFPSLTLLGRVPDYEFGGWYLYPAGAKSDISDYATAANWVYEYDELYPLKRLIPAKLEPFGAAEDEKLQSITGDERSYLKLGDSWDAGIAYGAGYGGYQDRLEVGTSAFANPVSFVGRWVPSTESRAADANVVKNVILDQEGQVEKSGEPLASAATLTLNGKALDLYQVNRTTNPTNTTGIAGTSNNELKDLTAAKNEPNDNGVMAVDFARGGGTYDDQTYYLRVGADVASIDLEFHAAEIFYQYNMLSDAEKANTLSPVQIVYTYVYPEDEQGERRTVTTNYSQEQVENSTFTSLMLPLWETIKEGNTDGSDQHTPHNSAEDSAHSRWTVKGIDLRASYPTTVVEDDREIADYIYNEITITVMSPSVYETELEEWEANKGAWTVPVAGEGVSTYTFKVQKLRDPTLELKPGNTPAGMIQRDSSLTQAQKDAILAQFKADYQFATDEYPKGKENAGGMIYRGTYTTNAWTSWMRNHSLDNIDLDDKAIVVYLDSEADDPGVILTDSEGNPVEAAGNIVRTLKAYTAPQLTIPALTSDKVEGDKESIDYPGKIDLTKPVPVVKDGHTEYHYILPGIYTLEYKYTDPVTGETYTVDKDIGWTDAGKEMAANFERTMVVLPIPGDVDMDGVVTSADAVVLKEYLTDEEALSGSGTIHPKLNDVEIETQGQTASDGVNAVVDLFAYRVADVHKDGKLNKANSVTTDVTELEKIPTPRENNVSQEEGQAGGSDFYYIALSNKPDNTSEEEPADTTTKREPWTQPDLSTSKAKVELVFLGKEGGKLEGDYYISRTGPNYALDLGDPEELADNKMQLQDVMWVGVKLTGDLGTLEDGSELKDKYVDTFTFTLVYDNQYLRPASLLSASEASGVSDAWQETLRLYNTTGNGSQTVWHGGSYSFTGALQSARAFEPYDTKLEMPLEAEIIKEKGEGGEKTYLRELVFSVKASTVAGMIQLNGDGDQWLLAVPFRMIRQRGEDPTVHRVEMVAGMSDFTIVFRDSQTPGAKMTTLAYNPFVDENEEPVKIFGGVTQNLATYVDLATPGPDVPLGPNKTQSYYIRNDRMQGVPDSEGDIVYSTNFQTQFIWPGTRNADGTITYGDTPLGLANLGIGGATLSEDAPDWLSFHPTSGTLWGMPREAKEYSFYIGDEYFCYLIVEKAPLHYWADNQSTYYGEEEYRGALSEDLTFSFDPKDILELERNFAAENGIVINDNAGSMPGELLKSLLTHTPPAGEGDDPVTQAGDGKRFDYTPPEFTAVDEKGAPITAMTPVRDKAYVITAPNEEDDAVRSTNYRFIYETRDGVEIQPRPFEVVQLRATKTNGVSPVGTIFNDESTGVIPNLSVQLGGKYLGDDMAQVEIRLKTDTAEGDSYDGLTLTNNPGYAYGVLMPGDSLELLYSATLLQLEEDAAAAGGGYFNLGTNQSVRRPVQVSGLRLVGGTNSDNYALIIDDGPNGEKGMPIYNGTDEQVWRNNVTDEGEWRDVYAVVRRRNIVSFNIKQTPPMRYQAGEQLSAADQLRFDIRREADANVPLDPGEVGSPQDGKYYVYGTYTYHPETTLSRFGVTVTWVKLDDETGEIRDEIEYKSGQTFTVDMNGYYLCLSATAIVDGGEKTIRTYSETQLVIEALTLTLAAKATTRYYGEADDNLGFTYDPAELSIQDQTLLRELLHVENLGTARRDGAELDRIFEIKWRRALCANCEACQANGCNCADAEPDDRCEVCGQAAESIERNYTSPALDAVDIKYAKKDSEGALTDPLHPDELPKNWGELEDEKRKEYNIVSDIEKTTNVGNTTYVVLISGAKYEGYRVQYTYGYFNGNDWVTKEEPQQEWGASRFGIEPRPIVVEGLLASSQIGRNLVTVYADTKKLDVDELELALKDVVLGGVDAGNGTVRYYQYLDKTATTRTMQYTGPAVVKGDEEGLSLTYTATVVPQAGKNVQYPDNVQWTSFAKGYFNMNGANGNGEKSYPVQVSKLELVGDKADNYLLVYRDGTSAGMKGLAQWQAYEDCIIPKVDATGIYYIPKLVNVEYNLDHTIKEITDSKERGAGTVTLRPIASVQILSPGKVEYTYGDVYTPNLSGPGNRGMQVEITYETTHDHWEASVSQNVTREVLDYKISSYNSALEPISSLEERGLSVYYTSDPGFTLGTNATAIPGSLTKLAYQAQLSVGVHSGKFLVVAGKRGNQSKIAGSTVYKDPQTGEAVPLIVHPKTLVLRADDQYRAYGEPNPEPTFTFDIAELAAQDRRKLLEENSELSGRISGDWLKQEKLGLEYVSPIFAHTAVQKSDVLSGGRAGYDIVLGAWKDPNDPEAAEQNLGTEGSLANYVLKYEPGTLFVYPRRVHIEAFKETPIHTLYSDMTQQVIKTNVYRGKFRNDPSTPNLIDYNDFTLGVQTRDYIVYSPDGKGHKLALTKEVGGLLEGDSVALSITLEYVGLDIKNPSSDPYTVLVTDAELVSAAGNPESQRATRNYVLDVQEDHVYIANPEAKGNVALRSISSIKVVGTPANLNYKYGDDLEGELDLWGLIVSITYAMGETVVEDDTVIYRANEDFNANGLYVNYYPYDHLVGEDDKETGYAEVPNKYYTAATGDHVTIAPTHDSMANHPDENDPKHNFSADGMYLVVTAKRGNTQAAEPQIVKDRYTQQAVQIHVEPRPLNLSLSAQDKTYDGSTEAAGTITLSNVFQKAGYVDPMNRDVIDMVYPVLGTDSEKTWSDEKGYKAKERLDNFTAYVNKQGYTFTTGTYDWADQEKRELWEGNEEIQWTAGYKYSDPNVAHFSFLDPNVAYAPGEDIYGKLDSKQVQLTGLRLGGADAANYTLAGITWNEFEDGQVLDVTRETLSDLGDCYREGALPDATIYKANREALSKASRPRVEVDPNTNVVRILYDGDTAGMEYALQYQSKIETVASDESSPAVTMDVVTQWVGEEGQDMWWDGRYFGGEAVTPEYPEGYVPRSEDISKGGAGDDAIVKGQVYQWAEQDPGFRVDPEAYPGGASAWSDYYLYATDRTPLDRDTVYWALVRMAETHNYKPSAILSSVSGYEEAEIQAVLDGWEAQESGAGPKALEEASQAALSLVEGAVANAKQAAAAESARMAAIIESGQWPDTWVDRGAAPAVKTYIQRLDLISVEALKSATGAQSNTDYQVPTLEAVWFTDILEYAEKKDMDAVARNMEPVRYHAYAWDPDFSADLFGDKEGGLSLAAPLDVEVTSKSGGSGENRGMLTVNEDHIAQIYVSLSAPSAASASVTSIKINSEDLKLTLDTKPFQLTVTILPQSASRAVTWTSSNEAVAVISASGVVTVKGVGMTVITATASNQLSDSIVITVVGGEEGEEFLGASHYPDGIFNDLYVGAFFPLDETDNLFHPDWVMTRGEVAMLLARFYRESPSWTKTGPDHFSDITGEEPYAEAVLLLAQHGVIQGMPGGTFNGELTISRAEFITLLVRMMGLEVPDTTGQVHAFRDTGEEDTWAYREIDAMSKVPGVLLGVGDGYFAPGGALTRGAAAAFLCRLLQFPEVGEDPIIPRDVFQDHWGWDPILRAVNHGDVERPRYKELMEETEEEKKS